MSKKILLIPTILLLVLFVWSGCHTEIGEDVSSSTDSDNSTGTIKDDPSDYVWDNSQVIGITLKNSTASVSGSGATVSGSLVTITAPGTYGISGSLTNGQIVVNSAVDGVVRLILNGATISCSNNAPIFVMDAEKVVINLAASSVNSLTDGASYNTSDEPNAALYSKSNLTIFGEGSLVVNASYNDGITSKDGLIIDSGNITVNAKDDGIRGKDYLLVKSGTITVKAGGDGLKSDNDSNAACGYINILKGTFAITSSGDAISAETAVNITDGKFDIVTGVGSSALITSSKGIKGNTKLIIETGNYKITSTDDALHANTRMTINSGTFSLSSGDDGIHADSALVINGGNINITKCYEGIESAIITINNGTIHLISSDDGINAAGGGGGAMVPGGGGMPPGQGGTTTASKYFLYMNGGYVYVDALGDGIDINGSVMMTSGTLIVNGPTANDNGALDYDGTFQMSGGTLVAAGSSGMAMAPGSNSTINSLQLTLKSTQLANTLVNVQTSDGKELLTFAPSRKFQSVVFSSSTLVKGSSYKVYYGGSSTGSVQDGIYKNGTYTPGTQNAGFSVSSYVTKVSL